MGQQDFLEHNGTKITGTSNILRALGSLYPLTRMYGVDPLNTTQIDYWIDYTDKHLGTTDFKQLSVTFDALDNHFTLNSFLVGYHLSLADICLWGALRANAIFNKQIKNGKLDNKHLIRWYNHVGSMEFVAEGLSKLVASREQAKDRSDQGNMDIELVDAKEGQVVTRFPPEPSGYLHIGHAKAAMLNEYFARQYKGKMIVRFDDTNPTNEKAEFENSIKEDLLLLGIKPDVITHTSDSFGLIYEQAIKIIKMGKAYCDDTDQDTMRHERFEGIDSKNRNMSVEETLAIFDEMTRGTEKGLKYCLRAKINMQELNKAMRDPVIYRCNLIPHHTTGDKWKVYPTYDFACPIVDALEGVTHALRTVEYRDRNAQYQWFIDTLKLRQVHIWDFSRLNFVFTVLSKRKLTWFVEKGLVSGWDDPRFPTVRGIRRRGMTIEALRQYILSQGASQKEINLEWDKIWSFNKKVVDLIAPRHVALAQDNLALLTVVGEQVQTQVKKVPKHKKNPELGDKSTLYGQQLYLEQEDAKTLEIGEEVTMMDWGNVIIKDIKREDDLVKSVDITLNLDGDFKKTKKKLTWLSAVDHPEKPLPVTLLDYDYLVTKSKLEPDDAFEDFVNPVTEFKTKAIGDANLKSLKKGDIIQFERKGFFICDQVQPELVFITIPDPKTVGLKAESKDPKKQEKPKQEKAQKQDKAQKQEKPAKQAKKEKPQESSIKMYQVKPVYAKEDFKSQVGSMYTVKNVYDGMDISLNVPQQPASPPEKQEKQKKEKQPKQEKKAPEEQSIISKLNMCVGKVLSVKKHPDADSLYVEEIDVGEDKPRTVVSGLVKFMTEDQILGRTILVLKNLKPVAMRGIKSHAMVLCASNAEHDVVEFLVPPEGSLPGERVYFEGHEGEPEDELKPKKKVWETVQPDFSTTDDLVAVWKDVPFRTHRGVIKAPTLKKASIK
ncbi:tRNA synthetases class I, catalytic domain-containing protein [Gorgonomyces haynaldii]|nr:tRNA synthetases class I, catalytic domain-containing protein [Gorgonomyces haynaldii]